MQTNKNFHDPRPGHRLMGLPVYSTLRGGGCGFKLNWLN